MRIEKINNNKLKIMFDSEELEENNITVHSFLSGSSEAQKLFLAILDIANEEFGFDIKNCTISSETFSFGNKEFVILVTKNLQTTINFDKANKISPYNLLEFVSSNRAEQDMSLSFLPPPICENLIYRFRNLEEVFAFCKYVNSEVSYKNLVSSLYRYNNSFFIIINIKKLATFQKELVLAILSEYQDYICLSPLTYVELLEHSTLILENKAIQAL